MSVIMTCRVRSGSLTAKSQCLDGAPEVAVVADVVVVIVASE